MNIPHTLAVAHADLTAKLDEAIAGYKRHHRFPRPALVFSAIEAFVYELELVPVWFAELKLRATLVELRCGKGSAYANARRRARLSLTPNRRQSGATDG
jgi:hypothetical protein